MLGDIPQGSALGPLLFLVYVNEMPLKVQHGCLLQFADDTCLICAGDTSDIVAKTLQDNLTTLSGWVFGSVFLLLGILILYIKVGATDYISVYL